MARGTFTGATLLLALLGLMGCGSSEDQGASNAGANASSSTDADASAEAEAEASAEAEAERKAQLEQARLDSSECQEYLGDLLEALKQIDGRLDVGLTNADLGTRLGDVAVAYNDIPFKKLGADCVTHVGIPLENAYNEYAKSKDKWDACIESFSCQVEGAKLTELQGHWSKASKGINRARRVLTSPQRWLNATGQ